MTADPPTRRDPDAGATARATRLPEEVRTARLTLRRWRRADAPALSAAVVENLDHLRPWMAWVADEPLSDAGREALIEAWDTDWAESGDVVFGVFLGDTVIGGTGLHRRRGTDALEIGYWVHVDHTRRGYATEIATGLTSAAFGIDGIERVEIHHDRANEYSGRVPAALGYTFDGETAIEVVAPGQVGVDCAWSVTREVWRTRSIQRGRGRRPRHERPRGPDSAAW